MTTTLATGARALPQAGPDRILDELLTVHPYSKPGSMTSTADGSYLYAAEGGAIAVIEARTLGVPVEANYQEPIKRVPVASLGVLPVQMLLDPGANAVPAYGDHDILYIAGGRDGLWAMQADVLHPLSANPAVRLDDSGNELDTSTQFNRKWCNDLAFITLDEGGVDETT